MLAQNVIDLVKERTYLVALVSETVKLSRLGKSLVGLCPFCKIPSTTPTLEVVPWSEWKERGYWKCRACNKTGDAISFLMLRDGLGYDAAVQALAKRLGIGLDEDGGLTSYAATMEADLARLSALDAARQRSTPKR